MPCHGRKIFSGFCLTFALASCDKQQTPAAEPTAQPGGPGAAPQSLTQEAARARLRAVVRDSSFLEHVPESVRATAMTEPFAARMVVLYMVDDRGAARNAQAADLAASGVTREALRAVVEWNLASLLHEPVSCTSHPLASPLAGTITNRVACCSTSSGPTWPRRWVRWWWRFPATTRFSSPATQRRSAAEACGGRAEHLPALAAPGFALTPDLEQRRLARIARALARVAR